MVRTEGVSDGYCHIIINSVKTAFRPRSNYKRLMVWILLATFACYNFAYVGTEGSHRYLYVKLEYDWDQEEFTTFLAAYKGCYLIALWILLPFASRTLKLHDASTLIIACVTGAIGNLMFILYARWRFKIVCLQTKLASLAIRIKSNFYRFLASIFHKRCSLRSQKSNFYGFCPSIFSKCCSLRSQKSNFDRFSTSIFKKRSSFCSQNISFP